VTYRAADRISTSQHVAANAFGFVVFWTLAMLMMMATHNGVTREPAYVRAAGVPLGFTALALVMDQLTPGHVARTHLSTVVLLTLGAVQIVYALGAAVLVPIALTFGFAGLVFGRRRSVSAATRQIIIGLMIALIAGELAARYVSWPAQRIGPIPASAILAVFRCAAGSLIVAAAYGAAASARFVDGLFNRAGGTVSLVAALSVQLAFFHIDAWTNPVWRCVLVAAVLAAAVGVARWLARGPQIEIRLYSLTVVCVLGLTALQFAYFYTDYFGR
jgi:hypothetical protein